MARKIHWKRGLPVITDSVDRPLIWRNGPREFDLPHVHPKLIAGEPVVARGAVDGGARQVAVDAVIFEIIRAAVLQAHGHPVASDDVAADRSEEHTSELQSRGHL